MKRVKIAYSHVDGIHEAVLDFEDGSRTIVLRRSLRWLFWAVYCHIKDARAHLT